jgi:hypothetical protein
VSIKPVQTATTETKITCKQRPDISPKSILIFDEHPLNNNLLGTIAILLSPKDGICIQV